MKINKSEDFLMKVYNVAIDGPAGAGKSTVARMAAKELGFVYVDTGAMYRALALAFFRRGITAGEKERVLEVLPELNVNIAYQDGEQIVFLNGEDVTSLLRTQEIGNLASDFAPLVPVREKLRSLQQELAARTSVIMDGRDIGTVVLPGAEVKIFLTADASVRADRRVKELCERGISCDREEILNEIRSRDLQDEQRENSPLKKADDAILLDASALSAEEVAKKIVELVRIRCAL